MNPCFFHRGRVHQTYCFMFFVHAKREGREVLLGCKNFIKRPVKLHTDLSLMRWLYTMPYKVKENITGGVHVNGCWFVLMRTCLPSFCKGCRYKICVFVHRYNKDPAHLCAYKASIALHGCNEAECSRNDALCIAGVAVSLSYSACGYCS